MAERFSRHAAERAAQRYLSCDDLAFVLQYGQEIHRAGALFIFLGQRDIPQPLRNDKNIMRLAGTAVVISSDRDQIITAYVETIRVASTHYTSGLDVLEQTRTRSIILRCQYCHGAGILEQQ